MKAFGFADADAPWSAWMLISVESWAGEDMVVETDASHDEKTT